MTPYTFLAALPALLALAGFVLYQLLGSNRTGDEITRRIVDKLRRQAPNKIDQDQRLTGSQVEHLLLGDETLQKLIGKQDFLLLQQALRQQFITSLTVYSLSVFFCALSVVLFVRQAQAKKELQVDHFSFSSLDPTANGLPVDLDPLQVTWQSAGEPEEVKAYLENVQTRAETTPLVVPASVHNVRFQPDVYHNILQNRQRGQTNQIRVVIQSKKAPFASDPVDFPVGITVFAVVDGEARLTVAAMIDNSRIPNYDFEAKIVVPSRSPGRDPLSIGPSIPYRFPTQRVSHPTQLD